MTEGNEMKGYEFTEQENSVISALGTAMLIVSIVLWLSGLALLLLSIYAIAIVGIGIAVLVMSLGMYLWKAARSMRKIVKTQGQDIMHLMEAVENLTDYFKTIGIVLLIVLGIAILGLLVVGVSNT